MVDYAALIRPTNLVPLDLLVPDEELRLRALEIALNLKHPIYDCFYLALAEREGAALISADRKLIAAGKRVKGVEVTVL
jgi:predicted nucleic acid-binding protein